RIIVSADWEFLQSRHGSASPWSSGRVSSLGVVMALVLEAAVRTEILARRRYALDKRVAFRLSALLWLADGLTHQEVADLLGLTARQVRKWVRTFRTRGLDALCTLGLHVGTPNAPGLRVCRATASIDRYVTNL